MSDLAITQQAASLLLRTANETGEGLNAGMPLPNHPSRLRRRHGGGNQPLSSASMTFWTASSSPPT